MRTLDPARRRLPCHRNPGVGECRQLDVLAANINATTVNVRAAFNRVQQAMVGAGYSDESRYEILAQTH